MRKTQTTAYTKKDFEAYMNGNTITPTNTAYTIEHNVPIPSGGRITEFPLLQLKPSVMHKGHLRGDAFTVPISKAKSIRNAVTRAHKRTDFRFVTRTVKGRGKAGKIIRVWRIV